MTPREKSYGTGWRNFTTTLRYGRAQARCECDGRCGRRHPTLLRQRCNNHHNRPSKEMRGLVKLQAAHLCKCDPLCQDPAHVLMLCQPCHLRFDMKENLQKRAIKRILRQQEKSAIAPETPPKGNYSRESIPPVTST